jgi:hypothetical protein
VVKSRVETTKILANAITSCKTPPKVFATVSGVGRYTVIERGQYTAWLGKEIFNINSQQFYQYQQNEQSGRGQYTAWLGKEIFNIDSQQFYQQNEQSTSNHWK